jgi:nicotinate-nucleotide pyrophosphorylase (carboxylating)
LNTKPETLAPANQLIEQLIALAVKEDLGDGDHSSLACIPENQTSKAKLLVKQAGVLSGVEIAKRVAAYIDPNLKLDVKIHDGQPIQPGDIAFYIEGSARSILAAERLILNIMQRMSGIATQTQKLVALIHGTPAQLLDTRKTAPGMRILEKMAVVHGGGHNHRMGLYDMIMLKDNHIDYAGGIVPAIQKTHEYLKLTGKSLKIEIEARSISDVRQIVQHGGVHRIMLDNFSPEAIREALPLIGKQYETEASGGIREDNLREYAETGVQFISVGALTHQVKSLDLSLKAC